MAEHVLGIVISALIVLTLIGLVVARHSHWANRWQHKVAGYPFVRVAFERGVAFEESQIEAAMDALATAIDKWDLGRELLDLYIEVVLPGRISTPTVPGGTHPRTGALVGGSIRTERKYPWSQKVYVAVVTTDRPGSFVVHEASQHIWPVRVGQGTNASHRLEPWGEIETEAKALYVRGLEMRS